MEKAGTGDAVMVGDTTWDVRGRRSAPGIQAVTVLHRRLLRRGAARRGRRGRVRLDRGAARARSTRRRLRQARGRGRQARQLRGEARLREDAGTACEARRSGRTQRASSSRSTTRAASTGTCASSTEGTLASWALPRGVPEHPDENRLAVRTEDHPLEYLDFHGEIPKGEYGAGTMAIWDSGTYEAEKFRDDEVIATFHGERLHGRYALFRTRDTDWMIHRMDPPEDPDYEPFPDTHSAPDARTQRAAAAARGAVRLRGEVGRHPDDRCSRTTATWSCAGATARDFTPRYPEVRELGPRAGRAPDRARRRGRGVRRARAAPASSGSSRGCTSRRTPPVRRRMRDIPATYVIFDLLYLDGHTTMALPYEERRELLERARAERAGLAHARLPPRRGQGPARRHEGARHRGHRREEARLPVHARRARLALDQGQERPHPGRGHRRLDAGRGRAQREPRLARRRRDGGRGAACTPARSAPASPSRRSRS